MRTFFLNALLLLSFYATYAIHVTVDQKPLSSKESVLSFAVQLAPNEFVYQDHIVISADHPSVHLDPWTTDQKAESIYDKTFKENKQVFAHTFTISTEAKRTKLFNDTAHVHITLLSNQTKQAQHRAFPIQFKTSSVASSQPQQQKASLQQTTTISPEQKTWRQTISDYVKKTDSPYMRVLFVFLLGLLLSLTPCIYPMIPITVGILQSQGSTSLIKNFFLSLSYTLGLATTFSCMGLIVASSGQIFGSLMGNPLFVCAIVAFLAYFAFSLFGFYTLRLPKFFKKSTSAPGKGSFLSIFFFGLVSGTIASPCLSPGLALVLSMVASMANKLMGFVLLFVFGLGISTPLVIIGTFSGSINLLPRAGGWMIEVQKIFGFMLLGMCFYYLSGIMPWYIISFMLTIFVLAAGFYYLQSVSNNDPVLWRNIKNSLGIALIGCSIFLGVETLQEIYYPKLDDGIETTWYTDYHKALSFAQQHNKPILIDFWAPYCSICTTITNHVLKNEHISPILTEKYVVVQINAEDAKAEPYASLQKRYAVIGVPTVIITDPSGHELKRWGSDLYDSDINLIKEHLNKLAQQISKKQS